METFKLVMEVLGSLSMLFIGISMCIWGPLILKAVDRVERRQNEQWERHYEFEVSRAKAIMKTAGMILHPVEPKDEH